MSAMKPIEEMDREEAIMHLCGHANIIAEKSFVEVFSQTSGRKPATLIGLEVNDKEAGLKLLANLRALANQIQLLPVNP